MSETAVAVKDLALGDVEHELRNTRTILEVLPEEHFGWKPHEKSMSLGGLATHVANLSFWGAAITEQDEVDLATLPPKLKAATSRDEVLRMFDQRAGAFREALSRVDDGSLARAWTLRRGAHVISRMPKALAIRQWSLSHLVHHRGQLTVYLRMLNVPVPGMYGPSADEQ